jgi:hypothetical protein
MNSVSNIHCKGISREAIDVNRKVLEAMYETIIPKKTVQLQ